MDFLPLVTFVVMLVVGVLSGMSGGGGGFVAVPYLIGIGMNPAHALATSKFAGLGVSAGSLTAFRGKGLVDRRYLAPMMLITFTCALLSAYLIPQIEPGLFQKIIGVTLLVLLPTLFINRKAFNPGKRSKNWIIAGFIAYTIFSFLQTLAGSGLGTMVLLVMMYLFGMDTLHAMATKRVTQTIQAVVLMVLLALQGLVVWTHAIAGGIGSMIGTHIGTKIALKEGVWFIKIMLAVVMAISGVALLL